MMRRRHRYGAACLILGAACLSSSAWGQGDSPPIVESVGEARIEVPPAYAEFELEVRGTESTLKMSSEYALAFEKDLRANLKQAKLAPRAVTFSGVRLEGLPSTKATLLARVRFALDPLATPEDRARQIATLADKMRDSATLLKCDIRGPRYGVDDTEAVEQEAIARATENALYKADAVALVMNVSIVSVESVRVLEVTWGHEGATAGDRRSDAQRIVCTARAQIRYRMSAS